MFNRRAASYSPSATLDLTEVFDLLDRVEEIGRRATGFEDWLIAFMEAVCSFNDWSLGHAWAPCADNPRELKSLKIWHIQPGVNVDSFRQKTEQIIFKSGVGLPGRVHEKKRFDWIFNVLLDDNYPRKPYAEEGGLKGGYGCPVIVNGEVAAIIEFYDDKEADPDPHMVRLLEYLGMQIAPVLDRSRALRRRNDMADELEQKVASSVGAISEAAGQLTDIAAMVSKLTSGARDLSNSSAGASSQSTDQVKLVAHAAEDLIQTIQTIQQELDGATSTISTASERITAANGTFESLKAGAREIEDVIVIINKIADKTKLLSLNATIEASRAGALGAGFAVVASEVKELAAQTEQSTNHIAQRVQEIQAYTSEAGEEFNAVSDSIAQIEKLAEQISRSMETQQQCGLMISENSNFAKDQSQTAFEAVKDVAEQLSEINDSAGLVSQTAFGFAEKIQDLQAEVGSFVEEIRHS